MKEITVTGLVSKNGENYVLSTNDGTDYCLSAILPWEGVSSDYGTSEFEMHVGKCVTARGVTDGHTIYKTTLRTKKSE